MGVNFLASETDAGEYILRVTRPNGECFQNLVSNPVSHNLELLSFQKMCGLLEFIRKMKALQWSVHGQS